MYNAQKEDPFTDFPYPSDFTQSFKASHDQDKSTVMVLLLCMKISALQSNPFYYTYKHKLSSKLVHRLALYCPKSTLIHRYSSSKFLTIITLPAAYPSIPFYLDCLIEKCTTPMSIDNYEFNISINIGVSLFLNNSNKLVDLIYASDKALSHSLLNGPNQYYIYDTYEEPKPSRSYQIYTSLQTALLNNEIYPVFQPKISAKDNKILGFEVLARWNHPILGDIPPNEFIPIAEKSHLIFPIGRFIFEQACKGCRELIDLGYTNVKFSINVSTVQVQDPNIIGNFTDILYKYDLNTDYIDLEVTENISENIPNSDLIVFQELNDVGFSLALDDFGTGAFCFDYLKNLPIDTLKIDKRFIQDIGVNPIVHSIIQSLITLSHELKIKVVAEGVETLSQVKFLQGLNCDIFQGYFYSKPVAFNELLKII